MPNAPDTPLFYFQQVLQRWKDFEGRSRRAEFWWFFLFNFLIGIGLALLGHAIGLGDWLRYLYALVVLIPVLAVYVRRLHDTDRSGWWLLMCLVPLVGAIVLIVFLCQDSSPGTNRFGNNPKGLIARPTFEG